MYVMRSQFVADLIGKQDFCDVAGEDEDEGGYENDEPVIYGMGGGRGVFHDACGGGEPKEERAGIERVHEEAGCEYGGFFAEMEALFYMGFFYDDAGFFEKDIIDAEEEQKDAAGDADDLFVGYGRLKKLGEEVADNDYADVACTDACNEYETACAALGNAGAEDGKNDGSYRDAQ